LAGISTPQTLEIEGYIKKKKVIVLIDSGSTHNFIHCKLAKALNFFVYLVREFQVMIADGGTINCSKKCNKINLTMGEYVMNIPMISIPMGGVDVVLGIQWLQSLGTMAFNFQELFMKFSLEGKEIELRGITGKQLRPQDFYNHYSSEVSIGRRFPWISSQGYQSLKERVSSW
jgi:hypothetical protein